MERLFDSRTNIIFQNPAPITYEEMKGSRKWLLLPMIAYKVLVPYPMEKELNLFQETVLKLFISGSKTAAHIAEKLIIEEELASFIIDELIEKNLLTSGGLLTEEGKKVLTGEEEKYELKIGYIFYDILNKNYWDTFIFNEEYQTVESESGEKNRCFYYGNIGKPRREFGEVIRFKEYDYPKEPSNKEILEVCIKHKRRMSNLRRGGYLQETEVVRLPSNLEKVRYLGQSSPLYAATYIFLPEDINNKSYWQVCHPFKGGISQRLRENIDKLKEEDEHSYLKDIISKLMESSLRVSDLEKEDLENSKNSEASKALNDILSPNINNFPRLHKNLLKLYSLSKEMSQTSLNRGKSQDEIHDKGMDFINKAYNLLEEALFIVKKEHNDYYNINYLFPDPRINGENLSVIAEKCGFADRKDKKILKVFLSVKKGNVANIDANREMVGLMAANLLIAHEMNEHPFWRLSKSVPKFVSTLADFKLLRDSSSHSNSFEIYLKNPYRTLQWIMYVLSLLLPGLTYKEDKPSLEVEEGSSGEVHETHDANEVDKKINLKAEYDIESKIGLIVRDYEVVKKGLIAVETSKTEDAAKCILNCSKVLEDIFGVIAQSVAEVEAGRALKDDMEQNLRYLKSSLYIYGFNIDPKRLPDSFKNTAVKKIRSTFKDPSRGVLNAKLFVILYSAIYSENEMVKEIGEKLPEIIMLTAKVSEIRGHGNNVTVEPEELLEVIEELYDTVKKLLPIIKNYGL